MSLVIIVLFQRLLKQMRFDFLDLKKPLDTAKTYNLKVVVTLEDGKTVVGDSRKFTIKNLQSSGQELERKEKREIRCAQPD